MSKFTKLACLTVATLATVAAEPAFAAPISVGSGPVGAASSEQLLTEVQFRGGYRGGWRRGWRGPGIGLGIGAGLLAGAIIADRSYAPRRGYYYDTYAYDGPYYYPNDYRGDPREICARNFRSFEWRTGLYTTYGGEKRLCPYL